MFIELTLVNQINLMLLSSVVIIELVIEATLVKNKYGAQHSQQHKSTICTVSLADPASNCSRYERKLGAKYEVKRRTNFNEANSYTDAIT